jgi:hypothetical protein
LEQEEFPFLWQIKHQQRQLCCSKTITTPLCKSLLPTSNETFVFSISNESSAENLNGNPEGNEKEEFLVDCGNFTLRFDDNGLLRVISTNITFQHSKFRASNGTTAAVKKSNCV